MVEINTFSAGRNDRVQTEGGETNFSAGLSGGDVVGLLLQARNLGTVKGAHDAAVSEFFGKFGSTDLVRNTLSETMPPETGKQLKLSDRTAKFLKDELGVTEQYIEGNTVHFKLDKPIRKEFPGAPPVWLDKDVNFKIKPNGDKIEITDINGIMAKPDYSPWVYITRASLQRHVDPESGEESDFTATVHGGRIKVYVDISVPVAKSVYTKLEQIVRDNGIE
ncbi:MAG TPA: hypothetical protein V6C69_08425 [Trichormus sp.]